MKIQDFTFSRETRKDTALVDFINDINKIINLGRYQMRVVSSVPTWTGEEGEHLIYVSGTVRRLYWYDITNSTWQYLEWNATGEFTPTVVASVSLTLQTASISATTIYTPASAGIYRASVHHLCSVAGAAGNLNSTILWTNIIGATSVIPPAQVNLASAGSWGSGIVTFRSTATAIQYSTTVVNGAGSKYSLDIALERLL